MATNFLMNLKKEYLAKKKKIESVLNDLDLELKENIELQKVLRAKSDESFESFVPREINPEDKRELERLSAHQKKILAEIELNQKALADLNQKMDELESVIKLEKEASKLSKGDVSTADKNPMDDAVYRMYLLETQENERYRISRELHDDTVQNLTSLVHKAELCSKLIDMDPVRCRLELMSMIRFLREVISDTRKIIFDLRPMTFDDIGLDVTVERILDKLEPDLPKKIHYHVKGQPYPIKPIVGITIIRIIQEACSNALRHAKASSIDVFLCYGEYEVAIEIADDGIGFRTEKLSKTCRDDCSGFGIATMRERVFLLSGKIVIDSELGQGTKVKVWVAPGKEKNNGN